MPANSFCGSPSAVSSCCTHALAWAHAGRRYTMKAEPVGALPLMFPPPVGLAQGTLPDGLGSLANAATVDVSRNNFAGGVPASLQARPWDDTTASSADCCRRTYGVHACATCIC